MRINRTTRSGFTLIELLIVVLIISILAAIATPNFLEFQVRAKVSRAKADMKAMETGIEAYNVDNGAYPPAHDPNLGGGTNVFPLRERIHWITTPIAYLSTLPPDVFTVKGGCWNPLPEFYDTYDYYDSVSDELEDGKSINSTRGAYWRLSSAGPDLWHSYSITAPDDPGFCGGRKGVEYDPTNGSVSAGDITLLGPLYIHETSFFF
ncbi:prepilin-type N-terminal cleavage/methylation domain-containing protein [Candidatus Sumerlaeota bacterium]|nr:prepilin-type N-terminal cleavage/methylation domain-containing protein [Candidatus Sumerlaeota bacterium]